MVRKVTRQVNKMDLHTKVNIKAEDKASYRSLYSQLQPLPFILDASWGRTSPWMSSICCRGSCCPHWFCNSNSDWNASSSWYAFSYLPCISLSTHNFPTYIRNAETRQAVSGDRCTRCDIPPLVYCRHLPKWFRTLVGTSYWSFAPFKSLPR